MRVPDGEMEGLKQGSHAGAALASPAQAGPLVRTLIFQLCALSPEELQTWQVISLAPSPVCRLFPAVCSNGQAEGACALTWRPSCMQRSEHVQ